MFRIIANGVELDTHKDIDVSFDFQLEDVVDISKRKSSFSSTIILPGTDINNKFFKHIKETTIDNQLDAKKRIRCSVKNGVSSIMEGYMELLYINNIHGSEEYEVSITQSNRNIWDDIKDYKLSDLDFTRFDHIRNKENIVKSMDTSIIRDGVEIPFKFGRGYVYPTISYGNHLSNIEHYQYTEDTFPALYVKEIWDTLFREFGYEYNSKFINSEYFSKLIIPFNKAKVELSQSEIDRRSVMVGVNRSSPSFQWQFAGLWHVPASPWLYKGSGWSYDQKIPLLDESSFSGDNQFRDDAGQWNDALSLGYVAEKSGYYNIDVDLMCRIQGRSPNTADIRWAGNDGTLKYTYKMSIVRNNGQTTNYVPVDNVGNNTSWDWIPADDSWRAYYNGVPPIFDKPGEEFPISKSLSNIYLNQGEKVLFYVKLYASSRTIWNTRNSSQGNQSSARLVIARYVGDSLSKFQVTLSDSTTPPNEKINMNQVLDENMTLRDFFKSILDTFNMMIIEDPTDSTKLLLEPRLDFFKSRQRVLDWDEERKLDHSDIIKIDPMGDVDVKKYLFTYTKDDDYFNKSYENKYDEIYSQIEIDTGDEFSNKDFKIESKFSPTPISSFLTPTRPMPYFLEGDDIDDLKPKRVKPRILFYGGVHETNEYRLVDYANDPNPVILKKYAYCGMWDSPKEPKWDLGFTSPREVYHSSPSFPTQNLYQLFYKDYISNLININNVILEAKFHLTPKDIDDFDFRDIIFLDREYWRIISIEGYNPIRSDLTTKVKLIKIMDFESFIESQLPTIESNNNCPIDVRIVSSGSIRGSYYTSSLGIITEACCNQLGGNWTNGQCRVVMGSVPGTVRPGGILRPGGVGGTEPTGGIGDTKPVRGIVRPVVPITNPYKPSPNIDNNTTLAPNVLTRGEGNYIDRGSKSGIVIGNNNTINAEVRNAMVVGDDITPMPNTTAAYIGNVLLDEDGNIDRQCGKPYMIDSGQDMVYPVDRRDPIDIIDGTIDSVRNRNGDSKHRPIIDNSECPFEDVEGSSDFIVNNRRPLPNQVITFFDRTTGTPDGWEWNFGDGNTSTDRHPEHSYDTCGDYTVSLHSLQDGDYLEEIIKVDYIYVLCIPIVDFEADILVADPNETISFTDLSQYSPTTWLWDFGDGNTSTLQNPTHTYTLGGFYTITLTATNMDGTGSLTKTNYIEVNMIPIADFSVDNQTPNLGDHITFTDLSLNSPTSWLWDFGDGNTSTLQNPTHTYSSDGFYDITLTVTNANGSDTIVKYNYINTDDRPIANFSADKTSLNQYDNVVQFTDLTIGLPTSWLWDFGDGNTSTLQNPIHTYTTNGTFDVTLTANNLYGTDSETKVGYITRVAFRPFIIKVNSGPNSQFTIPTDSSYTYNYDIVSSGYPSSFGETGDKTLTFPLTNTDYIIEISGIFPRWIQPRVYSSPTECEKVIDIIQWGDIKWRSMGYMFYMTNNLTSYSAIDTPNLSNVNKFNFLFANSKFNGDISGWDVSSVTDMSFLFQYNRDFIGDISGWDVGSVTDMKGLFWGTEFDGDISGWNVSSVTSMSYTFQESKFDGDISGWNVGSVINTGKMFEGSIFNGNISGWDVSKVINMGDMFRSSQFNGNIYGWDVSKVTSMSGMFAASQFDKDISGWNVNKVTSMSYMFPGSIFNKDISGWNVNAVTTWTNFRSGGLLSTANTPPKFR